MKMGGNRLNRAGFTILEALIAVSIVAFGLLSLMRALSGGLVGSKRGHDVTAATLVAQEKLDETWAAGYPGIGITDGAFDPPNDNFEWEIEVITGPTDTVREISLSVWWPADAGGPPTPGTGRSKQRCLNIKSYMAQY